MKNAIIRTVRVFSFLLLLLGAVSTVANASDLRPKRGQGRNRGSIQSVAEPATIVLLGAGLISLAVYAKRKHGKKQ